MIPLMRVRRGCAAEVGEGVETPKPAWGVVARAVEVGVVAEAREEMAKAAKGVRAAVAAVVAAGVREAPATARCRAVAAVG